jgi:hypothetical protein
VQPYCEAKSSTTIPVRGGMDTSRRTCRDRWSATRTALVLPVTARGEGAGIPMAYLSRLRGL